MFLTQVLTLDTDLVDQIAGITGIGWTASFLGYLITVIGHGNSGITRLVGKPRLLLYVGCVLFVVTLGLDQFHRALMDRER